MADLLGNDIGLNFKGLLNLDTTINTPLDGTLRVVTDGEGDSSPLYLSTTAIGLGTTSIWDNTNARLGIGTTSPSYKLEVNGTGRYTGLLIGSATTSNSAGTGYFQDGGGFAVFRIDTSSGFNIDAYNGSAYFSAFKIKNGANADILITPTGTGKLGINNTSPTAQLQVKGSGSTSATKSLLVQNSLGNTSLNITDDQQLTGFSDSQIQFRLGYTSEGQGVSTRLGQFTIGAIDSGQNAGLRILTDGSGNSYIDGISDGISTNYDIIIGSRRNALGTSKTGNTTAETGTKVQIGFESATIPSAVLTLNTVTRGFLPPRMTTTQKNAIASPAAGLMVFDTTLVKLCVYTTAWETITSI